MKSAFSDARLKCTPVGELVEGDVQASLLIGVNAATNLACNLLRRGRVKARNQFCT
jgi:hypothetical protein